ncbi:MAG: 50S ribosomal protein L10 [Planctomycetota bacterium]|jgi:large subunit ribosomal protein L10
MPSKLNQLQVAEMTAAFDGVKSAIFVDFTGVGSEETFNLRKAFNEQNLTLRVVKTSLAKVALKALGTELDEKSFKSHLGVAFGEDPVAVAKAILEHRKAHRGSKLRAKGGFLENKSISAEEVADLSALPSRHQLLGQVVGTIAAPLTGFIGVQAAIIRKLLYALQAIEEKQKDAA